MSAVTKAVFDRMINDSTLTGLLGTFDGFAPIFTEAPLPSEFNIKDHGPYIVTTGDATVNPGTIDTKNSAGREVERDIRCYADLQASGKQIEEIAERVRTLFHRQDIPISGFSADIASVDGPTQLNEEDAIGRILTVSLTLSET